MSTEIDNVLDPEDLARGLDPEDARLYDKIKSYGAGTWTSKILKPLSGRRFLAAQSCGGMRFFQKIAELPPGEKTLGSYDGLFWDAVVCIYLCTAPDSESTLALTHPAAVVERAEAWADAQNLSPASSEFAEMIETFKRLVHEILTSATEPADIQTPQKKTTSGGSTPPPSQSRCASPPAEVARTSS